MQPILYVFSWPGCEMIRKPKRRDVLDTAAAADMLA